MKNKRVQVRTDIPRSLAQQMKIYAAQHNKKLYEVYEEAVREFLQNTKKHEQHDLFLVSN